MTQELVAHPLRPGAMVTFNESSTVLIKELTDHLDKEHAKYRVLYQ